MTRWATQLGSLAPAALPESRCNGRNLFGGTAGGGEHGLVFGLPRCKCWLRHPGAVRSGTVTSALGASTGKNKNSTSCTGLCEKETEQSTWGRAWPRANSVSAGCHNSNGRMKRPVSPA